MQIVIRNRFREAYLAGKLEEIPEYARQATIDSMEAQKKAPKEEVFSQFTKEDFIELTEEVEDEG